jgi:hypothetical protein
VSGAEAAWAIMAAILVGVTMGLASGWLLSTRLGARPGEHRKREARAELEQRLGADEHGGYPGGEDE